MIRKYADLISCHSHITGQWWVLKTTWTSKGNDQLFNLLAAIESSYLFIHSILKLILSNFVLVLIHKVGTGIEILIADIQMAVDGETKTNLLHPLAHRKLNLNLHGVSNSNSSSNNIFVVEHHLLRLQRLPQSPRGRGFHHQ